MSLGFVNAICVAATEGGSLREVDEVTATAGAGLEGDRFCMAGSDPSTQVTLIESEAIAEFNDALSVDLPVTAFRRNLVTSAVRLNDLVGRVFTVGHVELRGVELCEPCAYLQNMLKLPGVVKQLTHKGGLRCEILRGGVVRPGDALQPLS